MISYIKYNYIFNEHHFSKHHYNESYIKELEYYIKALSKIKATGKSVIHNHDIGSILHHRFIETFKTSAILQQVIGNMYPNLIVCMLEDHGLISSNRIASKGRIPDGMCSIWANLEHKILL